MTKLLWTGGWDSTFRLLNLLLVQEKIVKPYYIIDSVRLSTGVEIRTREKIKNILFNKYPKTQTLLLPTEFYAKDDIKLNNTITQQFKRLCATNFIGEQNEWLSRFTEQFELLNLELCIHKDDNANLLLKPFLKKETRGDDTFYCLKEDLPNPDLRLFKNFIFPIFHLRKLDMEQLSIDHGFNEIMEFTWFCFRPSKNFLPCGICSACRYTIQEGLIRRIPLTSRIRYHFKRITNKIFRPVRKI